MKDHLKRNFCLHIWDGSFFFLALSIISIHTVLPVMLNRLGATAFIIGMVPFIDTLVFNLAPLFTAHTAEKAKNKKRLVVIIGSVQRAVVLLAGIAILLAGRYCPSLLMPVVLLHVGIFALSSGFVVPPWADLVGRTIPKEIRGRMFSIRNVIGHLFGIGGSVLIAWTLTKVMFPANYAVLFFVAFGFMMFSFMGLVFVKDNVTGEPPVHAPTFLAYLHEAFMMLKKDRNFLYFNISRCFIVFAMGITAFFSAHGMRKFDLPDSYAGVFTGVSVAAYIVLSPLVGWWGDKRGNKEPLVFSQAMAGVAALAAIFAGSIEVYLISFVAITVTQVALFLTVLNMTLEFSTPEKSPTAIAVSGAFSAPVAITVLFLGKCAALTSYNTIFYVIAALSVVATLFTLFCLKDPRHEA